MCGFYKFRYQRSYPELFSALAGRTPKVNFLAYIDQNIISINPFQTIDEEGVGMLMKLVTMQTRQTSKKVKIGICGEHGGDPASINFFSELGLDYISTSPRRIPIAILSAAQSSIKKRLPSTANSKT